MTTVKPMLMTVLTLIIFHVFITTALPAHHSKLRRKFMKYRLDLLENGFNVFADEFVPALQKLQETVKSVTETNKELTQKLQNALKKDDNLSETVKEQDGVISDLLWAVADLKEKKYGAMNEEELLKIEWTLFDLKHSTGQLLEQKCIEDTVCGDWSDWITCSNHCGMGSSKRSRECVNGGIFKSYCEPSLSETTDCTGRNCSASFMKGYKCPENYNYYQGYCFRFSGRKDSRLVAKIICETDDAHLVAIDNPHKHNVVMGYLEEVVLTHLRNQNLDTDLNAFAGQTSDEEPTKVGIDGIQHRKDAPFLSWRDKEIKYFEWAKGEPNRDKKHGDFCITVSVNDFKWYLDVCTERFHYICEVPVGRGI